MPSTPPDFSKKESREAGGLPPASTCKGLACGLAAPSPSELLALEPGAASVTRAVSRASPDDPLHQQTAQRILDPKKAIPWISHELTSFPTLARDLRRTRHM